jgi:methylmalonyl-CoA mutase N-terminal domain/subunit
MNQDKTTKQMIIEGLKSQRDMPVYNADTINKISGEFEEWRNSAVSIENRKHYDITPHSLLGTDIPRRLVYSPIDIKFLDYSEDLGFPGRHPYTRGIHPNMYRGRKFTIRQLAGFAGPEDTNERIKFLLDNGATGVNIVFDIPTIQEYDSDSPRARGQVGMGGVAIDSVNDMESLFKDVPIDKMSVSLVTHYPTNTAILFAMYLVMAEKRGIPWEKLKGSVQNDMVMEEVVRGGLEFIPPRESFRTQCDNISFIRTHIPKWNCITLNGYNLREAGASAVTETSVAMANAIETLKELAERGHSVEWVAERISFFWDAANDFFVEIARLRAARRLWYRIMKYRFATDNDKAMLMRCHVQTSGLSLTSEEPMNNIVRAAYQALAAILGGTQSLHVSSYDEAYSVPTEAASLVSLRTQQIIQEETAISAVVDPLGGSFYVESLTDELENKILDEIDEIEKMGGIVEAINEGWLHKRITEYAHHENRMKEKSSIKIVAHNYHKLGGNMAAIDVFRYRSGVEERQRQKIENLKQRRDNTAVKKGLRKLREACLKHENVLPYCIEASRADATEGEIAQVFRETFGLWHPPVHC